MKSVAQFVFCLLLAAPTNTNNQIICSWIQALSGWFLERTVSPSSSLFAHFADRPLSHMFCPPRGGAVFPPSRPPAPPPPAYLSCWFRCCRHVSVSSSSCVSRYLSLMLQKTFLAQFGPFSDRNDTTNASEVLPLNPNPPITLCAFCSKMRLHYSRTLSPLILLFFASTVTTHQGKFCGLVHTFAHLDRKKTCFVFVCAVSLFFLSSFSWID